MRMRLFSSSRTDIWRANTVYQSKDDDEINRAVDALNDYLVDANKQEKTLKQESGSQQPEHL